MNEMWVDKYRPETIDEIVMVPTLKEHFNDMIKSKQLLNMTIAGSAGIGKTTLAFALCKELNASVLFVRCGTEGNIETVRTKVKDFAESLDIDNRLKVCVLDEADSLSGSDTAQLASSAQKSLRSLIEANQSDTRFILTANYENKIIGPIKSRCPLVRLHYTAKDLIVRLKHILDAEKITYTTDALKTFATTVIKVHYPDIRKIISLMEHCCASGELKLTGGETTETEYEAFVKDLYESIKTKQPLENRRHVIRNKNVFDEDWNRLAVSIFNMAAEDVQINSETLSELIRIIYRMNNCIDEELQFYAIILELTS